MVQRTRYENLIDRVVILRMYLDLLHEKTLPNSWVDEDAQARYHRSNRDRMQEAKLRETQKDFVRELGLLVDPGISFERLKQKIRLTLAIWSS